MALVRRILLALIAGVMLTLVSAWLPATLGPDVPRSQDSQRFLERIPTSQPSTWAWFVTRHHGVAHTTWIFRKGQVRDDAPQRPMPIGSRPSWAPIPDRGMRVDVHGYAWPWPALKAARFSPTGDDDFLSVRRGVDLPVRPIYVGFIADIVFWAALSAAIGAALTRVRSALRRRRGRCSTCGYDLHGSLGACPECGTINAGCTA